MSYIDKVATTEGPFKPQTWWRFRDDIFEVWPHGINALYEFTDFINSIYPTIQFVLRFSDSQLEFLDVLVHLSNGVISTDMFSKPTDGHLYLLPSSSHPKHNVSSIPYSIALRIKRICSTPEFLNSRLQEYKAYLVARGYDPQMVQEQFDRANKQERSILLKPQKKNTSRRKCPLVLDFNPALPNINSIIRNNIHVLYSSPHMKELFPEKSIFTAYRKCKSLKDMLMSSKPPNHNTTVNTTEVGCFKCNRTRCDLCTNFLLQGSSFSSCATKKVYHIRSFLSCTSKCVIYLATCLKCNMQYVGSTATEFKIRFRNHKSDLLNNRGRCELAVHFNAAPHHISEIKFTIIEQVSSSLNIDSILTKREGYWLAQLNTLFPFGLNKRKEFNSYKRVSFLR